MTEFKVSLRVTPESSMRIEKCTQELEALGAAYKQLSEAMSIAIIQFYEFTESLKKLDIDFETKE